VTTTRSTALVFGAVAAAVALSIAMAAAEVALRAVDGYGFGLRLRVPSPPATTDAPAAAAPPPVAADPNAKWLSPSQAEPYVRQLPVVAGIERGWFELDPVRTSSKPADPVLDERFASHEGFRLSSIYEWNERYVQRAVCGETRLQMPVFSRVPDLFMYQPADGEIYPQFRFMRGVRYRSGLQTNVFGWRGADLDLVKPPRVIRIAFVGASTTIDPHADPFSHPEYIETWLNAWARANKQPVRFEVINAGREGIDIQGVTGVVTQEVLPVHPDLVVDYEGGNQFWPVEFTRGDLPPRPKTTAEEPWAIERYSALAVRLRRAVHRVGAGQEPAKPALPVDWPKDLDERDPPLDDPRLPTSLPRIVRAMDTMRTSLEAIGATYVPSSFVWLVKPGMVLNRQRDSGIYTFLNVTYWPFSYAHMRRIADFQNRVFEKYAAAHRLPFIDLAAVYPFDPRLFFDAVHMTPAGIKLKAWLTFQQLVPEIARRIADGRLPVSDPGGRTSHPAFTGGRRLVALDDLRGNCDGANAKSIP
jgi:hypothetical protein